MRKGVFKMALSSKTIFAVLVGLVAAPAIGAYFYSADKTPAAAKGAAAPEPVKVSGGQICIRDLTQHVQFKDPASVRTNSVQPDEVNANLYRMSVSAKNSYGGYGDPMRCSCAVDPVAGLVTYLYCAG